MSIWKRMAMAFYWSQAQHHSRLGNIATAMKYATKIDGNKKRRLIRDAFIAGLTLRSNAYEEAIDKFNRLVNDKSSDEDQDSLYVRAFCRYWLAEINGEKVEALAALQDARSTKCKPILRKWLPM